MPYDPPSDQAVADAYAEILNAADTNAFRATVQSAELERVEAVLKEGTDQVSATLQFKLGQEPTEGDLNDLRKLATMYAGRALAALRSASESAALGVMAPTPERLPSLVEDFGGGYGSTHVEMLGDHPNNTLVEQFATPLMGVGTLISQSGSRSEGELLRASYGVIGAAAKLIAAIDQRPELRRDWE